MRTKGEWKAAHGYTGGRRRVFVFAEGLDGFYPWTDDDARTIALAGTAANRLDELGYDGDKCLEMLPEIMKWFEWAFHAVEVLDEARYHTARGPDGDYTNRADARRILALARPQEPAP